MSRLRYVKTGGTRLNTALYFFQLDPIPRANHGVGAVVIAIAPGAAVALDHVLTVLLYNSPGFVAVACVSIAANRLR